MLETRLKEHQETLRRRMTEKLAVAEHAWDNDHSISWKEASIIDWARRYTKLQLKETLHIHMTHSDQHLDREGGLELPGCWSAMLKRRWGGIGYSRLAPSDHVFPRVARLSRAIFACALKTTGASS